MSFLRTSAATRLLGVLLLSLATLAHAGGTNRPAEPFPTPLLHSKELTYTVLLIHPTAPKGDVAADARKLLASKYKELASSWKPGAPKPEVEVRPVPSEEVEVPSEELMRYIARSLSAEERKRLRGAKHATMLAFHVPFAQRNESLLAATRFAHQLAAERDAFLWDDETREYFSPKSWKESRLDGWTGGVPYMPSHITMHVYDQDEGEGQRIITLGMTKLGLPDLVVEQVPRSMSTEMGTVVNGIAQLLAEGLEPAADGTLSVDFTRVKDARMRKLLESHTTAGAVRSTKLRAIEGRRDKGDPENFLLELSFPGSGTPHARQLAAFDALLGKKPDDVLGVPPGDPELEEVTRKARLRLNELKPRVEKGLQLPERLLVKAGFRTDDGNSEHMWFEVTGWKKDRLYGTLANEPVNVSRLRLGSSVDVALTDVDDYLYVRPDGTKEGGESSRILMRREGQ